MQLLPQSKVQRSGKGLWWGWKLSEEEISASEASIRLVTRQRGPLAGVQQSTAHLWQCAEMLLVPRSAADQSQWLEAARGEWDAASIRDQGEPAVHPCPKLCIIVSFFFFFC